MPVQLIITLEENGSYGNVTVSGPMDNKMLCYGLLEIARDIVAAHGATTQRRLTVPEDSIIRGILGAKGIT